MFRVKLRRHDRTLNKTTLSEHHCSKKSSTIRAVRFSSVLHTRVRIISQAIPHSGINNKSVNTGNNGNNPFEHTVKNVPYTSNVVAEHSESLFCDIAYRRIMTICTACYHPISKSNNLSDTLQNDQNNNQNNEQNNALNPNTEKREKSGVWTGFRSLLISAPEGSGKSYLLSEVECSLQIMRENVLRKGGGMFQIVTLSAKNCRHHTSLLNSLDSTVSGMNNSVLIFRHHLLKSLQHLNDRNNFYTEEDILNVLIPLRIILILDDVENLLNVFLKDNENDNENDNDNEGSGSVEDSGINGSGSPSAIAAFHLREVLHFISIPNNGFDQIIVIGATRIAASMLPRGHLGKRQMLIVLICSAFSPVCSVILYF